MFEKINRLIDNTLGLDIDDVMFEALQDRELQESLIELNKQNLRLGFDAEGRQLNEENPYSERYEEIKGSDTVDLNDSGRFYGTFGIRVSRGGFEITGDTDLYGPDFTDRYGKILGFDGKRLEPVRELILPYLIKYINQKINEGI